MDWKEKLAKEGHRITKVREQIMDLLTNTQTPLSPSQIHEQLREQGSRIGLVSVYRNLELLMAYELVCVVYTPDGSAGYVAGATGHHHHILCQSCHSSATFDGNEDFSQLIQQIETQTQFDVRDHFLQFYGICRQCKEHYEDI